MKYFNFLLLTDTIFLSFLYFILIIYFHNLIGSYGKFEKEA